MTRGSQKSVLENVFVLILLGVLAGAIAGAGIGFVQKKSSSPSATAGH